MRTVKSAASLVTARTDIVAGFRWQAEEKARRADTYHEAAKNFRRDAANITRVSQICGDPKLYTFALGACALSAKGARQLGTAICQDLIAAEIDFKRLRDPTYLDSLERRYLLTCGDALGGAMRNVIGQRAQNIFSSHVLKYLQAQGKSPRETVDEGKIIQISWRDRCLVFDKKPKFIGKNIDLILLRGSGFDRTVIEEPKRYLACGELKGGIDPAGADEHWKTALAALQRVRTAFRERQLTSPPLFFACAAIEQAMAAEIFAAIQSGELAAAANLHHDPQMTELAQILTTL